MRSLFRAAEEAAAAVRRQYDVDGPPVDVHALAEQMNVDQIVVRSMIGDGRLEEHPGCRIIAVQAKSGAARRRFTIAHELGHIWLQERRDRSSLQEHDEDERFCNAFAAALLLPRDWVATQARTHEPTLEGLQTIAKDADVSLASCLLRLRRFPAWRLTLLSWRWDEGDWRMLSITGLPAELRAATGVATVSRTRQALDLIAQIAEQPVRGSLWLGIGDRIESFPAEIVAGRLSAVAVVDLTGHTPPASSNRWDLQGPARGDEHMPHQPFTPEMTPQMERSHPPFVSAPEAYPYQHSGDRRPDHARGVEYRMAPDAPRTSTF